MFGKMVFNCVVTLDEVLACMEKVPTWAIRGGAPSVEDVLRYVTVKYPTEITEACSIDETTEHSLENFGFGSAWMYESQYAIGLYAYSNKWTVFITIP